MLVFISDLHFVDETSASNNVPFGAFKGVFNDLKKYALDRSELKIVLLGDVFDLLRSTRWLTVGENERPWGQAPGKLQAVEIHAGLIFDEIVRRNEKTLAFLRDGLRKEFGSGVEIVYIPGNHDRLCNVFASLRKKVRDTLGVPGGEEPFPHAFDDKAYGVFARHGHEFDVWNYEGTAQFTDEDYAQIPVGDLITTEIATRIPYTIMNHVGNTLNPESLANLRRNLEEVDCVRPLSSIFQWLFFKVQQNPALKQAINDSMHEIVDNFNGLAYLERWYKRHDRWNLFKADEADQLQAVMALFHRFDIDVAEKLASLYARIFGSGDSASPDQSDKCLLRGAEDFLKRTSDYRYYVMGHTHKEMQSPVRITSVQSGSKEQAYLNTGTWRKTFIQGASGEFIGLKRLTYTSVYAPQENPRQEFETWTGTLKES